MNIWALYKDRRIKLLLLKIQKQLGYKEFFIDDEDNRDYLSIGLVKASQTEVRAYIYIHGQSTDLYGVHLEYPWFIENEFNDTILVYEDLTSDEIINTLATHFEVSPYQEAV